MMSALVMVLAAQVASSAVQVGVADVRRDGRVCLSLPGTRASAGDRVTLLQGHSPQSATVLTVERPVETCDTLQSAAISGPYYLLTAVPKAEPAQGPWVAIRGRVAARVQARSCTSTEGLHLTLWDGVPLKSTRLWHEYFYLGYDVEPSCEELDYAPE